MLSEFRLTILMENRVSKPNLIAEHGFSLHVETPERILLFDTGRQHSFIHNARILGLDLRKVNDIFISHGHTGHTGGMYYFLEEFERAHIVAHPTLFNKKYILTNGSRLEIGVPYEQKELEALGAKFTFSTLPHFFSENIFSTGEVPRVADYEKIDEAYRVRVLESDLTDELHDDMALVLKTEEGLVIMMGCAHSGTINTIRHAMRTAGINEVYAVVGGMHLNHASAERIEKTTRALKEINPRYIIPLHCTGFRAISYFFKIFPEKILLFNVGDVFALRK